MRKVYTQLAVLLLTTQRELRGLFSCLHEAALSPAKWNDFVRLSAASLGASSSALVVHDPKGGANIITASAGISAEATDNYIRHYGQLDEWFLNSRDRIKTGWVGTGDELVNDSDLLGSEFYHDFLRHHGMFRQCGAVLGDSGAAVSTITFLRERKAKSFGHPQLGLLRLLVPEIQNAVRVHRVIAEARRETASLAEALDMLPTGVIKVDPRGKPLFINRAAREITKSGASLSVSTAGLTAFSHADSQRMNLALANAMSRNVRLTTSFRIRKKGGDTSVLMLVLPSTAVAEDGEQTALLFVSDPDAAQKPKLRIIQELFGLSIAEGKLAAVVATGRSVNEAAEELGVSANTVKTQLRSVFNKTGTSRQIQLVRLLSVIPPSR